MRSKNTREAQVFTSMSFKRSQFEPEYLWFTRTALCHYVNRVPRLRVAIIFPVLPAQKGSCHAQGSGNKIKEGFKSLLVKLRILELCSDGLPLESTYPCFKLVLRKASVVFEWVEIVPS